VVKPKNELLKLWTDWSDGVGYLQDSPDANGYIYGENFVGMKDELRLVPVTNTTSIAHANAVAFQHFFSAQRTAGTPAVDDVFIYVFTRDSTTTTNIHKISGRNADFGTLLETYSEAAGTVNGRPQKYNGRWCYGRDTGAVGTINEFTTINNPPTDDAFTGGTVVARVSHLALLGSQMVRVVQGSGVGILKVGGAAATEADWGSTFPASDAADLILAVATTQGLTYVLNRDGLYTFNSKGRAGMVLGDLGGYRQERPVCSVIVPAFGGIVFPHPTGLIYYEPGGRPINISPKRGGMVPSGVTSLQDLGAGRFHGLVGTGSGLYAIFQPDETQTTFLVLWGQPTQPGNPSTLRWHCVHKGTLDVIYNEFPGIGFIGNTFPTSASYPRPVICFGETDDFVYMITDHRGYPLLQRGDNLSTPTSGTVIFSELFFPEPRRLAELVVHTTDMAVGDAIQFSVSVNNGGSFVNLGAPVESNGRSARLSSDGQNVNRVLLKATYSSTAANPKVPLAIKRMELYGATA